jgi:ethanolamine permease
MNSNTLKPSLSNWQIWGVAIGMVISGQYFGWNYAIAQGNFSAVLIGLLIVSLFYSGFMILYLQLSNTFPSSNGITDYCKSIFGKKTALLAGCCALTEYGFATCAITSATGAYLHALIPAYPADVFSSLFLILIVMINLIGIKQSAVFELIITTLALIGLSLFIVASWQPNEIQQIIHKTIHQPIGITDTIPYLMWLYLGIEGAILCLPNQKAKRNNSIKAIKYAMIILLAFALLTVIQVTLLTTSLTLNSNNPLPDIIRHTLPHHTHIVIVISILGLAGLIASLNGIFIATTEQYHNLLQLYSNGTNACKTHADKKSFNLIFIGLTSLIITFLSTTRIQLLLAISGALCLYTFGLLCWLKKSKSHKQNKTKMIVFLLTILSYGFILYSLTLAL